MWFMMQSTCFLYMKIYEWNWFSAPPSLSGPISAYRKASSKPGGENFLCILQTQWLRENFPLHWRHNDHDGVSNHQSHGCLLNRLFGRRSKKTSKLRVTGLCAGNSPGPVNSPHKGPVTRKMFPFDDVIMLCRLQTQWLRSCPAIDKKTRPWCRT